MLMKNSSKRSRKLCVSCQQRRALFRFRGIVKRDDDHKLCFRCFRSLSDSVRSRTLGL
jgi:hypothetical protein